MPPVDWRVGVIAGRDGVAVTDPAIATVDADLAAADVPDYFLGAVLGVGLGIVMGAGP